MNQVDWDSLANLITEAVLARLGRSEMMPASVGALASRSEAVAVGDVSGGGFGSALSMDSPGLGRPATIAWVASDLVASDEPVGLAMELAARAGAEQWVLCPTVDHVGSTLARLAGLGAEPVVVAWNVANPRGRTEALQRVRSADRVLSVGLGWSQARALVEADDRDFSVRLLMDALTAGRPVRLLGHPALGGLAQAAHRLATSGPDSLPGPLARKARDLLRAVELLGIEWVEVSGLAQVVSAVQVGAGSVAKTMGGLVTAGTVAALHAEGRRVLELPRGTVVTPLARDEARKLGVELRILEG